MRWGTLAVAALAASFALSAPASAFDTGAHADMTRDALAAEGFGRTATDVVQVNNWFIDLYENAGDLPHSGHGGFFVTLLGGGYGDREHWPKAVVEAADRSHFDSTTKTLYDTAGLTAEWDRLRRAVYSLAREARDRRDPLKLLTVLGMSLHQVQDFYSHTNWVEPKGVAGFDGPGWAAWGLYGSHPTWFDVAPEVRARERIYTGGATGIERTHGSWKQDGNANLVKGMNKDWPGRPLFAEAYVTAYFASRQWVQAVRSWVADEAFWQSVRQYANRAGGALDHDVGGSFAMSVYAGHWQGQGEPCKPSFSLDICGDRNGPGGSLEDLRFATNDYFEDRAKTIFRKTWEDLILFIADPTPPSELGEVAPSTEIQKATRFVRLRIDRIREIGDMDVGALDEAEYYAVPTIAGQGFRSATIFGHDDFSFSPPNAPFTFVKAVANGAVFAEPLTDLVIEVKTSGSRWSGTDDDVYLRISDSRRFSLDKRLYNDFERGDRDTYAVPIDDAVAAGLTVADVRYLQIEKSPDGVAGGWKLGGIKVWVNGRLVYANQRIERWLEDDHRTWRAPDFVPQPAATSTLVPIRFAIWDEDGFVYGADDHVDLHQHAGRQDVLLRFDPAGSPVEGWLTGDDDLGGRLGDGEEAAVHYLVDTIVPKGPQKVPGLDPVAPPVAPPIAPIG